MNHAQRMALAADAEFIPANARATIALAAKIVEAARNVLPSVQNNNGERVVVLRALLAEWEKP